MIRLYPGEWAERMRRLSHPAATRLVEPPLPPGSVEPKGGPAEAVAGPGDRFPAAFDQTVGTSNTSLPPPWQAPPGEFALNSRPGDEERNGQRDERRRVPQPAPDRPAGGVRNAFRRACGRLRPGCRRTDRKSTRLNSSHSCASRMPYSAYNKTTTATASTH